jgi:hypothetical protein
VTLRKTAAALAVAGLIVGLIGSGIGASFVSTLTATENIEVGGFACRIIEPSDGTIAGDAKSVTYNAPTITSSAAGNAPFHFTVENNGDIDQLLTVSKTSQTGNLSPKFSDMPASPSPVTLPAGGSVEITTGIQWTELDNDDLGRFGSMVWTINCGEASVGFDNAPNVLPGNLPSYGPEAYSFDEWGGQVALAGTARDLSAATVTLSSWACESGAWHTNDCATTPGATFNVPITFNVYNVGPSNAVGSLITSKTQTFAVPFRPSADAVNCTGPDAGKWFNGTTCFNGKAVNVTFSFAGETLPDNVIFGITFNTSNYGYAPLGAGTHPTDSLNIATYPGNGVSTPAEVGSWVPDDVSAYVANGAANTPFAGPVATMPTGGSDNFIGYMPAVQIFTAP